MFMEDAAITFELLSGAPYISGRIQKWISFEIHLGDESSHDVLSENGKVDAGSPCIRMIPQG